MIFSWRSARGRALLAGTVFMLLLTGVALVAVWRARNTQERLRSLEHTSTAVASLEGAHARYFEGQAAVAALAWAQDPEFADIYLQTSADVEQALRSARAAALAEGRVERAAALDSLIARIGRYRERLEVAIPAVLEASPQEAVEIALAAAPEAGAEASAVADEFNRLVEDEQRQLAAERAAGYSAADVTVWLLVGLSAAAFMVGAMALAILVASVARPLASLRASVRAITSGNLEARARVAGPEEVASLARDFNEMVSERMRAEQALRESEEKYRGLVENINEIIYTVDRDGRITYVSPVVEQLGGYRPSEVIGRSVTEFIHPDDLAPLLQSFQRTVSGNLEPSEYRVLTKSGEIRWVRTSSRPILEGDRIVGLQAVLMDITGRKIAEEALQEQVRRDPLTGVLNHAAIMEELRGLISSSGDGAPHAVAMVDVDGLKAINDTYGHQIGDAVLMAVGRALSRDGTTVGRYGGDEFVAILPGADRAAAERYRDAVLDSLAGAGLTDPETDAGVQVVVSIGLVVYPTEAGRLEELIKLADGEMYAARRQRTVGSSGGTMPHRLDDERAAKMVGQLVPLLTSPGDVNEKLHSVAHRLSVGAGYDAVNFALFRSWREPPTALNTFARGSEQLVEAWNREQREATDVPLRAILQRTRRPIIVDDLWRDERLTDAQRELVRAARLRSGLVTPMIWQNELIGQLSVASRRKAAFGPRDADFLVGVASQVTAIVRLATLVDELRSASESLEGAQSETVMLLAAAAEAHDKTTGLHLQNVRAITEALTQELGYGTEDVTAMGLAAVLHDIGKVRVPDVVLSTVGQLTDGEWELLKGHTVWGEEFLRGRPGFELAATIARSHHEHWDGGGYPDGLSGEAIPEAATIVAVADAFDAMTSDRPYKAARSATAALREIVACTGKQFSPKVVQALEGLHKRKMLPSGARKSSDEKAAA